MRAVNVSHVLPVTLADLNLYAGQSCDAKLSDLIALRASREIWIVPTESLTILRIQEISASNTTQHHLK